MSPSTSPQSSPPPAVRFHAVPESEVEVPTARPLFEILIRDHAAMLDTYLRAVVVDAGARDEVFQDTIVAAWRSLSRFDDGRPFGAWLRGIARRVVLAHYSGKRSALAHEVLDVVDERFASIARRPGDTFDEQLEFLRDCLAALPARSRTAVDLQYFEDVRGRRLAARLGVTVDHARKIVTRARASLQECMRRRLAVGGRS